MHCLANLLFFDIPLLYYYTNLNSSIICCIFSGDIYLSFGISSSLFASSKSFCEDVFVMFSTMLLPIKSRVAYAVFCIALFEAVFTASVVVFVGVSRSF